MNDKLIEAVARAIHVHCHAMTSPEDAARAALAAIEASGHAIVPVEPTEDMVGEGGLARLRHDGHPRDAPVVAIYAAMLAARPKVLP